VLGLSRMARAAPVDASRRWLICRCGVPPARREARGFAAPPGFGQCPQPSFAALRAGRV